MKVQNWKIFQVASSLLFSNKILLQPVSCFCDPDHSRRLVFWLPSIKLTTGRLRFEQEVWLTEAKTQYVWSDLRRTGCQIPHGRLKEFSRSIQGLKCKKIPGLKCPFSSKMAHIVFVSFLPPFSYFPVSDMPREVFWYFLHFSRSIQGVCKDSSLFNGFSSALDNEFKIPEVFKEFKE
jgi:hypothetical protein